MTEHADDTAERTLICGRPVEAFNQGGDTITVDLRCERIGPPARPASGSTTTRFVAALRYTDRAQPKQGAPIVIQREAGSLWNALLAARSELDTHGWYLPIAGARTDTWCHYAERRPEVAVVHRIDDESVHEGILTPAPPDTVGTVAAQRLAYQHWRATQTATPETPS